MNIHASRPAFIPTTTAFGQALPRQSTRVTPPSAHGDTVEFGALTPQAKRKAMFLIMLALTGAYCMQQSGALSPKWNPTHLPSH